ncbi:MAG: uroporphyrinogen-III C-methyltransferase [Hahellaceae bacterium]|nr:uroporphyrinogen-III C-methyltransferase [Hahellaceae bacterium]
MEFLPLFFNLNGSRVLLVGGGEKAARKTELLLKTHAQIVLCAEILAPALQQLMAANAQISHVQTYSPDLLEASDLVVAATDDAEKDAAIAAQARLRHLPVNVVNDAEASSFIFPSIIDRSPVIAAVSSSGQMPVLTRLLRNLLESTIPPAYGRLAELAAEINPLAKKRFPEVNQRRKFWERHLEGRFAELVFSGKEVEARQLIEDSVKDEEYSNEGEVYLVGAGPGDPDLLTFKALRLMRQADIVLYDRLVSPAILSLVRADAEKVDVGKERANHTLPQQDINELLVTLAKQGRRVLRLKGGDPFIFGRGGEEIDRLADAGVPFQVVPGITAASGCAAYAGIPLTHRDFSQSVRFITGHLKDNTCDLAWQDFVQNRQTLVFYMGLVGLPVIASQLVQHGMSPEMPVALVSRGTTPGQKVITGTLENIVDTIKGQDIKAPTLVIIGEVVKLREKLQWR